MKKLMTLLLGGVVALTLFVGTGNGVKAATLPQPTQSSGDCGCKATLITGAERNKMVSALLKSEEFKSVKKEAKNEGYSWDGANEIQIIHLTGTDGNGVVHETILIGVPFTGQDNNVYTFVFNDGMLKYIAE